MVGMCNDDDDNAAGGGGGGASGDAKAWRRSCIDVVVQDNPLPRRHLDNKGPVNLRQDIFPFRLFFLLLLGVCVRFVLLNSSKQQ